MTDVATTAPVATKPVRILVAEDSPLNRQVALMQLERLGYAADGVGDGTEALAVLEDKQFDIILMDCQMPEMSGYEATFTIRERERSCAEQGSPASRIYIIAMTANTEADNRSKCMQAGMDDYINKPVELSQLEAAIHRALADRATQKAIEEVIDPIVIARLRQLKMPGKPDPVAELVDMFLKEAPGQLAAMELAVKENDYTSLARAISAATSLKGSSGNLGARNLAALCDEIEQTAKNWTLEEVLPLVDRARQELGRVQVALGKVKHG
jgi:CheY-like chemotaxis protein/HPt (histidine-containing phosphotransfer) domain-containing protein